MGWRCWVALESILPIREPHAMTRSFCCHCIAFNLFCTPLDHGDLLGQYCEMLGTVKGCSDAFMGLWYRCQGHKLHNAWHGVAMGPVGCNFVCFECLRLKWLLWFYNFSPTNTHYKTRYSPHSWVLPFSQFLIVLGHSQQLAILCKEAHDGQKVIYFSFCFQIVKFPPFGRLNCVFLPFFFGRNRG